MKKGSRLLSIVLAGLMIISMAACGEKEQGASNNDPKNASSNMDAKQNVYKLSELPTDFIKEEEYVSSVRYMNDRIYLLTNRNYYDEMSGMEVILYSMNVDGGDVKNTTIMSTLKKNPYYVPYDENGEEIGYYEEGAPIEDMSTEEEGTADTEDNDVIEDSWLSYTLMDNNGIYLVMESNKYRYDESGNYVDMGRSMKLSSYDFEGKERCVLDLTGDNPDEYLWIQGVTSDTSGNIVIMLGENLLIFDANGKQIHEMPINSQEMNVQCSFIGKDDKLNLVTYNGDWTKMYIKVFNLKNQNFENDIELPGTLNNYSIAQGQNYDLWLSNSMGVFGYNIGDKDVTPILNYINSDLDNNNINSVFDLDTKRLLMTYYDPETYASRFGILTYVDPADIPDKEVISLGCFYLDYSMRGRIVNYNKTNEKYRITIKDYSSYSLVNDYNAGYTKLNNDIIAGQIPDILVLDGYNMPLDSYASKGVFADIKELIDKDSEIKWDDYMTNVFDAHSIDGKLYSVIPSFFVSTVIGKTSDVGEKQGWTMDEFKSFMASHPDANAFGETMTRDNMLWMMMTYNGSSYVDAATGKCHFDTPEFASLLEFIKQFPKEYDWENSDDYYMNYETQYREGRTLLMTMDIYDLRSYIYNSQGYYGEPVTLIGFPSEDGKGAVIHSDSQYAISAKSKNIEGAWEFLRYYLTPEYQNENANYGLPVLKDALKKKLEEAKERPYWMNEDGSKEYYDDTFWLGGQEIPLNPLSDKETDMLYDYISSINKIYYYNEKLSNIISEEVEAFFEGQKSVEEVTKIIQSRAQIYINENR